jgi:SAM-dependent methyltransferase
VTDTVGRFSERVADYDRYRPDYPAAALDAILAGTPPGARVVDVGAGTGQATRALVQRTPHVIAIEPNPEMRAALRANAPAADVRDATAERTGLAAASVDVVAMFQAFQWCDGAAALAEFARIVRPGGRIAVAWNIPDRGDPFSAAYEDLVDRHGDAAFAASLPPGAGTAQQFLSSPLVRGAREAAFRHEQRLDALGFRGRIRSVSYLPPPGPALEAILAEGDALFARFARGAPSLPLVYRTVVYLGERA